MRYHFKIHREKEGFWAECIELPGCVTQGDTKEELDANMQEALNLYLETIEDCTYLAPLPKASIQVGRNVVEVPVDPSVALAFSIRRQRIQQGMKAIYSYQRLERRCNPSLDLICRLIVLFPALSLDKILR